MNMVTRFRDLREDHDKNQETLAAYLHVTQATYSRYENGQIEIPIQVFLRLADFYGVSVDYLLGRTDTAKPYPPGKSMQ